MSPLERPPVLDDQAASSLLSAQGVTVRFGGLTALQNVEIDVAPATVVGLLGPNGAGKSTLLGVLSGNVHAQQGRVVLDGESIATLSPQARVRRGLGRTFQHPELFGELTVREHLLLAQRLKDKPSRSWSDPFTGRYLRPEPEVAESVESIVALLDLGGVAAAPVAGLPLGVSRLVEIGRALATGPKVVLLDEPFSGLNAGESTMLAEALSRVVTTRGVSMLLVEHDVEVVFALSSRVYVLDFGQLIAQGTATEVRADPTVRSAYLGEVEPDRPPATEGRPAAAGGEDEPAAPISLAVKDLAVSYGSAAAVHGVSFTVPKGSVTALLGANGAGKSTIARALSGLVAIKSGSVEFNGVDITRLAPHRIRALGLAYLPEGRGVFPSLTVAENLRLAVETTPKAQRAAAIERAMHLFPILAERRSQVAGTLSGGQQQMLSLARILADLPELVIADEISLGLAPRIVDEVFDGLRRAIELGVSLIVIEQFVHRALGLADYCHVMRRGQLVWSGRAADAHGEIFELYLGGSGDEAPEATAAPAATASPLVDERPEAVG